VSCLFQIAGARVSRVPLPKLNYFRALIVFFIW